MITAPQTLLANPRILAWATVLLAGACSAPAPQGQAVSALDQTVLGTARSFAVLGGSTVTNTGSTTVFGSLGVDPGLAVTGFPPGLVSDGTIEAGDAAALQAQSDTTTAYITLAGEAPTADLSGQDLGGQTLVAGVYHFSTSAQLTGVLTLDAQHDPNAVFIFQTGSTLTTASNSAVLVINGGSNCNVFWQIGSSATLGTTTAFKGNLVALASVTLDTGATVSGRAFARNGAVTLDTNDVSILGCTVSAGVDAGIAGDGAVDAHAPIDGAVDAHGPIDAAPDARAPIDAGQDAPPDACAGVDAEVRIDAAVRVDAAVDCAIDAR
jgi:hypothetical protein